MGQIWTFHLITLRLTTWSACVAFNLLFLIKYQIPEAEGKLDVVIAVSDGQIPVMLNQAVSGIFGDCAFEVHFFFLILIDFYRNSKRERYIWQEKKDFA